jgi:DNA polymerase III epsilon subunit-like protein
MVGAGRGGKDSMLARCSVVTLDFVPNEHDVDDDDDDEDEDDNNKNNNKNDVVEENVSTCTSVKVDEGGLTTTTNDTNDNANDVNSSNELTIKLEKQSHRRKAPTGPLDTNLIILYDKYVIPRRKVTDYRTEWSGITKETYAKRPPSSSTSDNNNDSTTIPIILFDTCKHEISQLFASINGKNVIVVGHGLVNDFDVLEIHHPISNIRDTSTYKPYQRETRKKLYPRKLSTLACEELGIHIQQQKQQQQQPIVGHSSVEDAAAALRLYWHKHVEWERSLGYPLLRRRHDGVDTQETQRRIPLKMYLDGCNLPISCRGVNFNDLIGNNANVKDYNNNNNDGNNATVKINNHDGRDTTIIVVPSDDFQIISRMRQQQHNGGGYQTSSNANHHNMSTAIIDWMPIFKSALSSPQSTILDSITIMFDGAKYENLKKYIRNNSTPGSSSGSSNSIREELGSTKTYKFRIDSSLSSSSSSLHSSGSCDNNGSIMIEITDCGDSTDDVLVYTTSLNKSITNDIGNGSSNIINNSDTERKIVSLEEVIDILSNCTDNDTDVLSHYIVIRRKAGGTKTHRRLFDKLHLRRPNEGALCLSSLTMGLHKNSLSIARELRREKSINSVIECELRNRDELRYLVVTNDVYLTDRLVRENRVLVLSYNQFTNMW